jgi:PKD repeat protein
LGALVILAVLLLSTLAMLPSRALGQANEINGVVSNCATAAILSGALVTLTEANGARPPSTVMTGGDGTYAFAAEPGHYTLDVEKAGFFDSGTSSPFRFDGTVTVPMDFCLDPTPPADSTLDLLVVTAASVLRTNELVTFPSTSTTGENTAGTWNAAANTVRLSKTPLTSQGLSIRYERVNSTYSKDFVNNTDYVVQDYWTGTIEILDPIAISDLDSDPTRSRVLVTYLSWTPISRLQFYPALESSYTAFKNGSSWMASEGIDWTLDIDTGIVTILGNFINGTDNLRFTYQSVTALAGAAVDAFYAARDQVVASGTTSAAGTVSLTLWADTFELRTTATGYQPNITSLTVSAGETDMRVRMEGGVVVTGHARDSDGRFISSAGLTGTLYDTNPLVVGAKVIRANVVGSLYTFNAPPGTYRMVIDANGFKAVDLGITLTSGTVTQNVVLALSDEEEYLTTVLYGAADWNNLTIYRNLTLNADSTLPGLAPVGLRDLRLQVDFTLGNGNGVVEASEATAFQAWVQANGPFYVTTDGFLTTNGKSYLSSTAYTATVQGLLTTGSKVWINTSTTYAVRNAPPYIATGAKNYFVNVTLIPDTNVSEYHNYSYLIVVPQTYELVDHTILPTGADVRVEGFTRITLDPAITATPPQVRMTLEKSLNGTARAKVAGPVGKFHVVNATFTNYTAYVAGNTTITFSAEDSTDPVGPIAEANFTWRFTPTDVGYEIETTFNYTVAGTYVVNLTVRETGGNLTYRDITIFVDDRLPTAQIRTNRTGATNANGTTLRVDEDILVRFDAGFSTDLAYRGTPDKAGVILSNGYAWDFDGDGITDASTRVVNWTFDTPGQFIVNLTVTDSVGWKSVNATLTAIVNDTTAPEPQFDILDPSREWSITSSLIERKTYAFNASRTTDNYNEEPDLNFTWTIPGPLIGFTGANHTFYGANISFAWAEWNQSYAVRLSVRDTGFPAGNSNTGNLTRNITVQVDTSFRPDLQIITGTLRVSPTDPEEGAQVTVEVNVTNKASRGAAAAVTTELSLLGGPETVVLTTAASWFDSSGNPKAPQTIASGETVKLVFQATVTGGQGNRSVQVYVYDTEEPTTWRTGENRASLPINVRQPAWQPYAIWGSVLGVIVLFVFGMYARRKIKAGEWRPIRGRREKGEKEERKPRKEVKEEKKRL